MLECTPFACRYQGGRISTLEGEVRDLSSRLVTMIHTAMEGDARRSVSVDSVASRSKEGTPAAPSTHHRREAMLQAEVRALSKLSQTQ